jgi:hypothetical protein
MFFTYIFCPMGFWENLTSFQIYNFIIYLRVANKENIEYQKNNSNAYKTYLDMILSGSQVEYLKKPTLGIMEIIFKKYFQTNW